MNDINPDTVIGSGDRTVGYETEQLQGVFPKIDTKYTKEKGTYFSENSNGNICVLVVYSSGGSYASGDFKVLIEFPNDYPYSAPDAYIVDRSLPEDTPHMYKDGRICYMVPEEWNESLTIYDAAIFIQTWIYAFCKWVHTGEWDWEEEGHITNIS